MTDSARIRREFSRERSLLRLEARRKVTEAQRRYPNDRLRFDRRGLIIGSAATLVMARALIRPAAAQILGFTSGAPASGLSDSAWAESSNRPSISGSVLTWTGPLGGGANNGGPVVQTRTLTASGSVTSSANNQVFQGLQITGGIVVTHTNVTFKQCALLGTGVGFNLVDMQGVGFLIEDCLLNGLGSAMDQGIVNSTGNGLMNGTIRRNNILNVANHVTGSPENCSISDNWFHVAQSNDADCIEFYGGSTTSTAQHNTCDGRDTASGQTLNSGYNVTDFEGTSVNIQLLSTRFLAISTPHAINNDQGQGGGAISWSSVGNGFWNCGGYMRQTNPGTITANSGNFNMVNPGDQSGSPVNGTGIIA